MTFSRRVNNKTMKNRLFLARAELFLVACLGLVALSIPASSLITPASAAGDECSQTKAKSVTALDDAKAPAGVSEDAVAKSRASYGRLPISFELNRGQTNKKVKFLSRGQGFGLFLNSHWPGPLFEQDLHEGRHPRC